MDAVKSENFAPMNRIVQSLELEILNLQEKIERAQDQGMSAYKLCEELIEKTDQLDRIILFIKRKET